MLCIHNPSTNVYLNLASEEYLLKNFPEDIFILYQNKPSVVVGRYQDINAEVNIDFAKENDIRIARRISGGGAVFHDSGNFNLVFIENTSNPNFNKYTNQIIEFLHQLKIPAMADERYGITINGLKISGSAQYIYRHRVMYHATLLYNSNLKMLTSVLDAKPEQFQQKNATQKRFVKSVKSPVTNLIEYLEIPVETKYFGEIIFSYFSNQNSNNSVFELKGKDITSINELKAEKFTTNQWIYL